MTLAKQKNTLLNLSVNVAISRLEKYIKKGDEIKEQVFEKTQTIDETYFLRTNDKDHAARLVLKAKTIVNDEIKSKQSKKKYYQWAESVQIALSEIYSDNKYKTMFENCIPERLQSIDEVDDTSPENVRSILTYIDDLLRYELNWLYKRVAYLKRFQGNMELLNLELKILCLKEDLISLMPKSVFSFERLDAYFYRKAIELYENPNKRNYHIERETAQKSPAAAFRTVINSTELSKRDFNDVIHKEKQLILDFQTAIQKEYGLTFNELPNIGFDPLPLLKYEYKEPSDSTENKERLGEYIAEIIDWITRLPLQIDIYLKQQETTKTFGNIMKKDIKSNANSDNFTFPLGNNPASSLGILIDKDESNNWKIDFYINSGDDKAIEPTEATLEKAKLHDSRSLKETPNDNFFVLRDIGNTERKLIQLHKSKAYNLNKWFKRILEIDYKLLAPESKADDEDCYIYKYEFTCITQSPLSKR